MPRKKTTVVLLIVALTATASAALAAPIHVISLGDSWANQWCEDMQWVLLLHGVPATVHNYGIYGSTSTLWAAPGAMLEVQAFLLTHPEVEYAVVSLGGNDLLDGYLLGGYGDTLFPIVDECIRIVIDQLLDVRPDLYISLNGYDFPNFEHTLECISLGQLYLGGNTYTQNTLFSRLTEIAADIAGDYEQVYHTDLLGTLQEAGGMPFTPNFWRPSPAEFFPDGECIHPRDGYWHLMQRLYDGFFDPLLNQTPTDDDTIDDDTVDDDVADDDVTDDDTSDDDDVTDDDVADDDAADDDAADDDVADDDAADDDEPSAGSGQSDDDDDDGCGC